MSDDVRYHRVMPTIWQQPWSHDAKVLALYLLTCDHRNTEGLFRMPHLYVQADLDWSAQRLMSAWDELVADGFIEWDPDASVVLIVGALRVQSPANANMAKYAVKQLALVPKSLLDARFGQLAKRYCERLHERLPERFTAEAETVTRTDPQPTSTSTSTSTSTNTEVQGAADADAPDEVTQQFDDHFWPAYPSTNGHKRDRKGALKQWRRLNVDDRRAAVRGARHKAQHFESTGEQPPYAARFLRDRVFDDYQQPIEADPDAPKPRHLPDVDAEVEADERPAWKDDRGVWHVGAAS